MFKMTIISVAKGQRENYVYLPEQERENLHSVDSWIQVFCPAIPLMQSI